MAENFRDSNTRSFVNLTKDTRVGRYRIIERIGMGGMGEVYLAEDTELKRQVALKFLSPFLASDLDCRARFVREAQAAAKLNHPNIVTIHEVGEFQGRPFFAMEYVEGQSLRELIGQEKLSLSRALDIAIQLCDGLQEAHAVGIIHRDVKPSNVIIDRKGHPKLLDFGLATLKGCEPLTRAGSTFGTAAYMSPEQVLGKEIDARSDIFSFGIVLYELLTGQLPFRGDHDATIMHSIAYEEPVPLHDHLPDAPSDLLHIIRRLLEKAPEDRYQSIADTAIELRRLKRDTSQVHHLIPAPPGQQISSKPPTPTSSLKRKIAFAAMAALIILAAATALFFISPFKSSTARLKRVAVVPFKNQTGNASLDPLGKMIADWTTQGLTQTGLVEVIPLEGLATDAVNKGAASLAKTTGASIIITGSYYKLGDSLQFQAKLMDAKDRLIQSIEPILCAAGQPMDGVHELRERVLGALAVAFDERLISGIPARMGSSPPTYQAYQQFIIGLDKPGPEARQYFTRAYELDTTFLTALLLLESTFHNSGEYVKADSILQFVDLRRDRLTRLQQLSVDDCRAKFAGNVAKALDASRENAKIAPANDTYWRWAWSALDANYLREAITAINKIERDARGIAYYSTLAKAYHLLKDYKAEAKIVKQARKLYPTNFDFLSAEARVYAALGKVAEIRKCFADYTTIAEKDSAQNGILMRGAAEELRVHGLEDSAVTIFNEAVQWYKNLPPERFKTERLSLGFALYGARHWQEAMHVFEGIHTDITDSLELRRVWLGDSTLGDRDQEIALNLQRDWIGTTAARLGDRETAIQISEWLKGAKRPLPFDYGLYDRACIMALLGEKEEAVAILRERLSRSISYLDVHKDMDFESLWDYPPFIELMKPKE